MGEELTSRQYSQCPRLNTEICGFIGARGKDKPCKLCVNFLLRLGKELGESRLEGAILKSLKAPGRIAAGLLYREFTADGQELL